MEITENYSTLDEAREGIRAHEAQGHRVLHENHYYRSDVGEEGNPTQVLDRVEHVYDDAPDNTPSPITDWRALYAAAHSPIDKLDILARLLGL